LVGDEELQQFLVGVAVIMDSVVSPDEMIFGNACVWILAISITHPKFKKFIFRLL
jgi:hypothetical protein